MMLLKNLSLTFGHVALSLTFVTSACAQTGGQKSQPPQRQESAAQQTPAGWRRYELDGGPGSISVLLPGKPEDFGVANMRRPSGEPLPTRVHMLSADAKVYFAAFVDLPKDLAEMSDKERGEVFYGSWNAFASKTSQVLEEKFGAPFPVKPWELKVGTLTGGGERRMQDFKVGTQSGRAQAMFFERRAYMVAAIWDERPDSEKDAVRFLNSFQVKPGVRVGGGNEKVN